jgi:hypothetical protein
MKSMKAWKALIILSSFGAGVMGALISSYVQTRDNNLLLAVITFAVILGVILFFLPWTVTGSDS